MYISDHTIMVDMLSITASVDEVIEQYNFKHIPPLNVSTLSNFLQSLDYVDHNFDVEAYKTLGQAYKQYRELCEALLERQTK